MKNEIRRYGIAAAMLIALASMNAISAVRDDNKVLITLPDEYVVKAQGSGKVFLKDLAISMTGEDREFIEKIGILMVTDSPDPGQSKRLAQHQVLFAIRNAGYDFFRVGFAGAKMIEVYGPGQKVDMKNMVDAIFDKIASETGWAEEDISLQVLSAPVIEPWLPPDEYEIHVQRVQRHVLGTSRYNVRFVVDKIVVRDETFIANVARQQIVYLPMKSIQRGDILTEDDLREEIRFVDQPFHDRLYVSSKEDLLGKRARTLLRDSEPIRWTSLENNYILNRGDKVQMVVRNGSMVMHTSVKVQGRGAPGDIVDVKTESAGKLVKAKVINKNLVELASI